jgi:hypothetical protein
MWQAEYTTKEKIRNTRIRKKLNTFTLNNNIQNKRND